MRLLVLAMRCPKCGRQPPFMVFDTAAAAYRDTPPDQVVMTVKCKCGTVYVVTARAYHGAA